MKFLIANTFTDSLAKLTRDEQKAAKITALDFQLDPINPGMQLHKITHSKDRHFWSARIGRDLRLIIHKTEDNFLLCHVGHHDAAYAWAERRKIEKHPKTGAAQIVVIPERVELSPVPQNVPLEAAEQPRATFYPGIFLKLTKDDLLSVGVPPDALDKVRNATEQDVDWMDYVPSEAGEALLDYHTTGVLKVPEPVAPDTDPFDHPDARRRFRVIGDEAELQRALDAPWAQWALFLHPSQREYVERDYDGPTRIAGVAGTGKTIVALHRAAHLARKNPDANILLTSILYPLIEDLSKRMDLLVGHDPDVRQRIKIRSLTDVVRDLYEQIFEKPNIADEMNIINKIDSIDNITDTNKTTTMLKDIAPQNIPMRLLRPEWYNVVDAWQVRSLDDYRVAPRLGKMTQPSPQQYEDFWNIFAQLRTQLQERGLITMADMASHLTDHFCKEKSPFDFIIADEAQDISVPQMRLLAVLGARRPNGLFFCGDLGQRIYQRPFSWKECGVDIVDRLHILHKNYRTSQQIQTQTARLLPPTLTDVDGHSETREGNLSAFNGPQPTIQTFDDEQQENDFITQWLKQRIKDGVAPNEMAIFVRYTEILERAAKISTAVNSDISCDVMQRAKGLEFRSAVVMACDDGIIPSQKRLERYSGDLGVGEIYHTERQLLYVAATRAREHLLITGVKPASEFLNDLI